MSGQPTTEVFFAPHSRFPLWTVTRASDPEIFTGDYLWAFCAGSVCGRSQVLVESSHSPDQCSPSSVFSQDIGDVLRTVDGLGDGSWWVRWYEIDKRAGSGVVVA